MRDSIEKVFKRQVSSLEDEIEQRCEEERQKAEEFIKTTIENSKIQGNVENETLKKEIEALKASLESRKNILEQYTNNPRSLQENDDHSWFDQLVKHKQDSENYLKRFLQ